MMKKLMARLRFYSGIFKSAFATGAFLTLADFLIYRCGFGRQWARLKGYDFHRSTLFWFMDSGSTHTRAVVVLSRLKKRHPELKTLRIDLEFHDESGALVSRKRVEGFPADDIFVIESDKLPEGFEIPTPFSGTLIIKQKLDLDDRIVYQQQRGLFASAPTYIDYYDPGKFVTTLHDYSSFLPDQGINNALLGMIPAYSDPTRETFLLLHSAASGVGGRDIRVYLYNHRGEKKAAFMPKLKPFAMRKIQLSELFDGCEEFLDGHIGQVMIEGFFRQLLRRTAYGVQYKDSEAFSIDHCFYADYTGQKSPVPVHAGRIKPVFSPFIIFEDERRGSAAILYQSAAEAEDRDIDVLIYDDRGKCVAEAPGYAHLRGNQVLRIAMRDILKEMKIPLPFVGHAELLFRSHDKAPTHQFNFEHAVEYSIDGKLAHVIFGADFWNSSDTVPNNRHRSVSKIVCNEDQTTYMAISNCSYEYQYALEASFKLTLSSGGEVLAAGIFKVGANETLFKPIEEFFPSAKAVLKKAGGVALGMMTETNCKYLTNAFFVVDRLSGALSVEHSLQV